MKDAAAGQTSGPEKSGKAARLLATMRGIVGVKMGRSASNPANGITWLDLLGGAEADVVVMEVALASEDRQRRDVALPGARTEARPPLLAGKASNDVAGPSPCPVGMSA